MCGECKLSKDLDGGRWIPKNADVLKETTHLDVTCPSGTSEEPAGVPQAGRVAEEKHSRRRRRVVVMERHYAGMEGLGVHHGQHVPCFRVSDGASVLVRYDRVEERIRTGEVTLEAVRPRTPPRHRSLPGAVQGYVRCPPMTLKRDRGRE